MFERNVANRTKSRFGSLGGSFGAEQCGLGGLADHKRPDQEGSHLTGSRGCPWKCDSDRVRPALPGVIRSR